MSLEQKVQVLQEALEEIREHCYSDDQHRCPAQTSLGWAKKCWALVQAIAARVLRETEV